MPLTFASPVPVTDPVTATAIEIQLFNFNLRVGSLYIQYVVGSIRARRVR